MKIETAKEFFKERNVEYLEKLGDFATGLSLEKKIILSALKNIGFVDEELKCLATSKLLSLPNVRDTAIVNIYLLTRLIHKGRWSEEKEELIFNLLTRYTSREFLPIVDFEILKTNLPSVGHFIDPWVFEPFTPTTGNLNGYIRNWYKDIHGHYPDWDEEEKLRSVLFTPNSYGWKWRVPSGFRNEIVNGDKNTLLTALRELKTPEPQERAEKLYNLSNINFPETHYSHVASTYSDRVLCYVFDMCKPETFNQVKEEMKSGQLKTGLLRTNYARPQIEDLAIATIAYAREKNI